MIVIERDGESNFGPTSALSADCAPPTTLGIEEDPYELLCALAASLFDGQSCNEGTFKILRAESDQVHLRMVSAIVLSGRWEWIPMSTNDYILKTGQSLMYRRAAELPLVKLTFSLEVEAKTYGVTELFSRIGRHWLSLADGTYRLGPLISCVNHKDPNGYGTQKVSDLD